MNLSLDLNLYPTEGKELIPSLRSQPRAFVASSMKVYNLGKYMESVAAVFVVICISWMLLVSASTSTTYII